MISTHTIQEQTSRTEIDGFAYFLSLAPEPAITRELRLAEGLPGPPDVGHA